MSDNLIKYVEIDDTQYQIDYNFLANKPSDGELVLLKSNGETISLQDRNSRDITGVLKDTLGVMNNPEYSVDMVTVTLLASNWDSETLTQTVTVNGILEDETKQAIHISPLPSSMTSAMEHIVYCSEQGENSLTFTCKSVPDVDIGYAISWSYIVDGKGVKQKRLFTYKLTAEVDGQTDFEIPMSTFDSTCIVLVQSGRTPLLPNEDFTLSGKVITLEEGVPIGRTIGIYVLKDVIIADGEDMISGINIELHSIPLDRLEELPEQTVTSDIPLHFSIDEDGGLVISYDNGL